MQAFPARRHRWLVSAPNSNSGFAPSFRVLVCALQITNLLCCDSTLRRNHRDARACAKLQFQQLAPRVLCGTAKSVVQSVLQGFGSTCVLQDRRKHNTAQAGRAEQGRGGWRRSRGVPGSAAPRCFPIFRSAAPCAAECRRSAAPTTTVSGEWAPAT